MLIYAGLDGDIAAERGAKLKALQDYFRDSNPRAWNMLGATDMSRSNVNRGKNLIVNSHGDVDNFAHMDAKTFYAHLIAKGFENDSFQALYLMACKVGIQDQAGSILNNFARDLHYVLISNGISIKLYAPRGFLTYYIQTKTELGQTYYVVTRMCIKSPEREYPLDEGILLVQP